MKKGLHVLTNARAEAVAATRALPPAPAGFVIRFFEKTIFLGGSVSDQAEADELINTINSLKPLLAKQEEDEADTTR